MMDVMVGFDPEDEFTAAMASTNDAGRYEALLEGASMKAYRIGVLESAFGSDSNPNCAPVNVRVRETIKWLKGQGVELVEGIEVPDLGEWMSSTSLYALQSKKDFNDFFQSRPGTKVTGFRKDIYRADAFHELNDLFNVIDTGPDNPEDNPRYYRTKARQEEFRRMVLNLMLSNNVDFLLCPNVQVLPPTREDLYAWKWTGLTFPCNTIIASQTILPAMSIPAGFADHLPVGMELIGKPFTEADLLRFAYDYEQKTSPRRVPESCPEL
jgi:Asp-tRNA(Asn)/Glu-tRNA(Gln) amidotransferase A subunit family amidase